MDYIIMRGPAFTVSDDKQYALCTNDGGVLCYVSWVQATKFLTLSKLFWDEGDSSRSEIDALINFITTVVKLYPKSFPLVATGATAIKLTTFFAICNNMKTDFSHLSVVAEATMSTNTKVNRARFTGVQLTSQAALILRNAETKTVTITLA